MGGNMEPPTNHILETKDKFLEMEKNLREKSLQMEELIFKKEEEINELEAQKNIQNQKVIELVQEYENIDAFHVDELKRKYDLLWEENEKLKEKENNMAVQRKFVERDNQELTQKQRKKEIDE